MFAILSRLEPTSKCDLMTKLKIYNGEEVIEKGRTKKIDVQELRHETKREGMDGISTRFIMKALDNALSDNMDGRCINPISVREALVSMVQRGGHFRRPAQALPRVPAGHDPQGVPRGPRERDHEGLRLLVRGASRSAVPKLPRSRRGLCQQGQGKDRRTGETWSPTKDSSSRSKSRSPSSARRPKASVRTSSPTCGRARDAA